MLHYVDQLVANFACLPDFSPTAFPTSASGSDTNESGENEPKQHRRGSEHENNKFRDAKKLQRAERNCRVG